MSDRLASLLADPARAAEVPVAEVPGLLDAVAQQAARLDMLKSILAARVAGGQSNGGSSNHGDRLLAVKEAAELLNVTVDWLRRQKTLPFRVEVSPGQVRYSARGIERFIARATK